MAARILIVDDTSANRYILEVLLKSRGMETVSAQNGREALEKGRLSPPDLIVTDILMPVMDGFALCRQWKSDEQLKGIPLIFYTATYTEPQDEAFALSLGADRFILKPQEPEKLMQIIREVLEGKLGPAPGSPLPLGEEMEFFRQYNEILFGKLEKKMADLERAHRKLTLLEEQYRLSFENVTDIVWTTDAGLQVRQMSPSVESMLGYRAEDFIDRSARDLLARLAPESMERALAEIALVLDGQTIPLSGHSLVAKDGTVKHAEFSGSPIRRNGDTVGMVSVIRDISGRKRTEEALRESEERYRALFEKASNPILVIDRDGRYIDGNDSALQFLECTQEQLRDKRVSDTLPPGERHEMVLYRLRRLWDRGGRIERDYLINGKTKSLDLTIIPCLWHGKQAIIGLGTDITERKRVDEQLRRSEARFRDLFHEAPVGYFEYDKEGLITRVNRTELAMLGYRRDEMVGRPVWTFIVEEETARQQILAKLAGTLAPFQGFERTYRRKDGTPLPVIIQDRLMTDEQGNITGIRCAIQDIAERKQAERKLQESEHRYRILVENANETILVVQDGTVRFVNDKGLKSYGYTEKEFLSIPLFDIIHPDDREKVRERYAQKIGGYKTPTRHTYRTLHKSGRIIWSEVSSVLIDWEGRPATMNLIADITEQKQAEEMLLKTMERLRRSLAGTVQAISMAVETRDPYTAGHQRRAADLARAMAAEMGFTPDRTDFVRVAATIHDLGKISVPAEILSKPTRLRDLEYEMIKSHSQAGYDILRDIDFPWPVAEVVLQHHERMDGSGYPQGLRGEAILLEARILAVADVVEAIASHRPYRPALGIEAALAEIRNHRGILYDPQVVDVCVRLFHEKGYHFS